MKKEETNPLFRGANPTWDFYQERDEDLVSKAAHLDQSVSRIYRSFLLSPHDLEKHTKQLRNMSVSFVLGNKKYV